ncbi:EAL domain-containing protein [Alkalihalobacterium sp. APHAB7]|uniref:EAL domain-containing protein n=1 Tax=Alkalihalobacterium sp. APHAB7 TaxID=3402081 RepID=UPI003AAE8B22
MEVTVSQFDELMKENDFYHFIQPIYNIQSWKKYGYEVLLRSNLGAPNLLFDYAKQNNRLYELDTGSIEKVFTSDDIVNSVKSELLFINIFPSTLLNPMFPMFILDLKNQTKLSCKQVVFEINESEVVSNIITLKERIEMLKEYGFLIAIDDLGNGWSSLSQIIELRPHFAKLDRYFSLKLSSSLDKQAMIQALVTYCQLNNIQLILEGLEYEIDLASAKVLGVPMGQGYLLGRPESA